MIGEFQCREPEIIIQQSYMNLPDVIAALEGDQLDLGIVAVGEVSSGPAFEFTEILQGRNVVACRPSHPLMRKRPIEAQDLTAYPWVAPLPGSPLMSDLQMILMSIGMSDLNIRYSGGSLMSVVNFLSETEALAVLPFSVVFALRESGHVTVLPYQIPQPNRSLGIMRRAGGPRNPASDRFASYIIVAFDSLRHAIKRHETAVVWGHS